MWPFSLLALVMVHCTWSYRHNNMCMICICKASSQTSDTWPTPENTSKNEYRSVKSRLLIHLRQSTLVDHHAANNNIEKPREATTIAMPEILTVAMKTSEVTYYIELAICLD